MISYEIIKEFDKIEEYFPHWDQLFNSGQYEASLSLDWTLALLKTHLDGASFFLIVLRDSTQILGIVPVCIREVRKHGLSLLTMFPLAEYFNTHSDLLLKNWSEELLKVLLEALFSVEHKWDIFRINRFVETNPILESITHNLRNNFTFKYDIQKAEPSFFIELDNNYDDFLGRRSANFRYQIKRVAKKIQSLGDITFLRNQDSNDFDEVYNTILSIEEKSWKHRHGTAISSTEKQREFYRELGKSAFNKGWLRLCILYLDHDPIAFEMGLVKCKKYYGVHGSYDEKFKKWNPGTALLARFIEDLIHDGMKEYDWFGEPFEFQNRWTDKFRWHNSLIIYNNTSKARLFAVYNTLKNRLIHNINEELVLRNPREIKPAKN
jgi:CelD/BcsL family acetyltransferase involved in cellulose biosynthesis